MKLVTQPPTIATAYSILRIVGAWTRPGHNALNLFDFIGFCAMIRTRLDWRAAAKAAVSPSARFAQGMDKHSQWRITFSHKDPAEAG